MQLRPPEFFGNCTIDQISTSEPIPNLDISMQISGNSIGQFPPSDDNDYDIVSALADEFLVIFNAYQEQAPLATRITMPKSTVMYQGAHTLRTCIFVLQQFADRN